MDTVGGMRARCSSPIRCFVFDIQQVSLQTPQIKGAAPAYETTITQTSFKVHPVIIHQFQQFPCISCVGLSAGYCGHNGGPHWFIPLLSH